MNALFKQYDKKAIAESLLHEYSYLPTFKNHLN